MAVRYPSKTVRTATLPVTVFLMITLLTAAAAAASSNTDDSGMPPSASRPGDGLPSQEQACIVEAAWQMQVPLEILFALRAVEGGRPGLSKPNGNGTRDLGVFQINTHWLDFLAQHYHRPAAEIEQGLIWDTCFNASVAAWILRYKISKAGDDFWKGVGNYHSATPHHHSRYLGEVMQRLGRTPERR